MDGQRDDGAPRYTRRRLAQVMGALPAALGACIGTAGVDGGATSEHLPAHHRPGGGFQNPPGSPVAGGGFADWSAFFARRLLRSEPDVQLPAGHLLDEATTLAGIEGAGAQDSITWLGHACFLIRLGGLAILTDPYLTPHASPLPPFGPKRFTPPALPPERLPPIDLVLLSHNHYDHLDLAALAAISRTRRPTLVTALLVSRYLDRTGFARIVELDWHQSVAVGGLEITALPAVHFSKRTLFDRNETLWCGFRLATAEHAVVFAGDTTFGPVFAETGRRYEAPDLALLPIGAYEPRLLMQGSHCTPEEAVAIGQALGARRICGMHWGTIRLTDEPPFEPPARFRAAATAAGYGPDRAWLPAVGETRLL